MVDLSLCKDYVHHIYSKDDVDGCGIFVNKYFITAGHIGKDDFWVLHGGMKISFCREDCTFIACNPKNADDYEIAIFPSKGIVSPLKLGNKNSFGDELDCYSIKHVGGKDERYIPILCKGRVSEVKGNFFLCSMSEILTEGSSGSPIFNGDELVGILVGCLGAVKKNILFNSISSILPIINHTFD